jgi:hypothetical protein
VRNYIIHIYRCEKDNPRHLIGIVESVDDERRGKRAFTNFDDLWDILDSETSERALPQKRKSRTISHTPDITTEPTTKVILEARNLSSEARLLLIAYAIPRVDKGEIVALADDEDAIKDISHAARNHGWMAKTSEVEGQTYKITIARLRRKGL